MDASRADQGGAECLRARDDGTGRRLRLPGARRREPCGRFRNLHDLTHVTRVAGVPALVAFVAAHLANNLIVTGAIAVSSGRSITRGASGQSHRATLGLDFLAVPLVFVFAWVYAAFGAIAAATLWVPILGPAPGPANELELEQTNEELLELMVKSIEARDPYTSGHSRRVQQFSTTIARAIG